MEETPETKRLDDIEQQLDNLFYSDNNIDKLEMLINEAGAIAQSYALTRLSNNIRQTKEKHLQYLLKERRNPKDRIQLWDDTVKHFGVDLTER